MASAAYVGNPSLPHTTATSSSIFAALGLLSAAGSAEKSNAAQYRARRKRIREDSLRFVAYRKSIALRFVLAGATTRTNAHALEEARMESRQHGDIVLLNTTEGRFTCGRKYLLWLRAALDLFPSASYIALGDDDIYIQLDHFDADLHSIRTNAFASRHVFWGLLMWKAYYNNVTMVTSTGFTGWGFTDWAAVAQRTQMDLCKNPATNASIACPGLREDHVIAAQSNQIGSPPFPMANGPLSALSRSLAEAIARDPYPGWWLDELVKTPRIAAALARPGGPRKSSFACWPVVDSVLGYWVTRIGLTLDEPVTLVNTPLMKQHHPWPSAVRGRFSNSSIILHGLKKPSHERFRELAIARGSGPFIPYVRECGTCKEMGWSTWPGSPMQQWRCCGSKVEPRQLKRGCRGRLCPRMASGHPKPIAKLQTDPSLVEPFSSEASPRYEPITAGSFSQQPGIGIMKEQRVVGSKARKRASKATINGASNANEASLRRVDKRIVEMEASLNQLRARKQSLERSRGGADHDKAS